MLSLFRPTYLLLGYSGAKLLFPLLHCTLPSKIVAIGCSADVLRRQLVAFLFKCALVGCTRIEYVNSLFLRKEIRSDVHKFPHDLYYWKGFFIFFMFWTLSIHVLMWNPNISSEESRTHLLELIFSRGQHCDRGPGKRINSRKTKTTHHKVSVIVHLY